MDYKDAASITEIKNHILKMKPGERLSCYFTEKGRFMYAPDLDIWVEKGLLEKKFYGPATYGHVDYFRI